METTTTYNDKLKNKLREKALDVLETVAKDIGQRVEGYVQIEMQGESWKNAHQYKLALQRLLQSYQ